MHAITVAVVVLVGLFAHSIDANAQSFDPKVAILGAWQLDFGSAIEQYNRETDPEIQQGMGMILGMTASFAIEIREDGTILMGGVEHPSRFLFETDDEGVLWMIPTDKNVHQMFNRLKFEGPDQVSISSTTDGQMPFEIPLTRMFPMGMLEEGAVDPDSEAAIQGWWTVDVDQIKSMDWIGAINDERIRAKFLRNAESESKFATLGFFDGIVYGYSDELHETQVVGPYTIRASDDDIIALSFLIDRGADSESPLLRIECNDENRIDLLMTYLAPGPLPMVRRDDVEQPSR